MSEISALVSPILELVRRSESQMAESAFNGIKVFHHDAPISQWFASLLKQLSPDQKQALCIQTLWSTVQGDKVAKAELLRNALRILFKSTDEPMIDPKSIKKLTLILRGETPNDLKVSKGSGGSADGSELYVASFSITCNDDLYKFNIEYKMSVPCDKPQDIAVGKITTTFQEQEDKACCGITKDPQLIEIIQKLLYKDLS